MGHPTSSPTVSHAAAAPIRFIGDHPRVAPPPPADRPLAPVGEPDEHGQASDRRTTDDPRRHLVEQFAETQRPTGGGYRFASEPTGPRHKRDAPATHSAEKGIMAGSTSRRSAAFVFGLSPHINPASRAYSSRRSRCPTFGRHDIVRPSTFCGLLM